MKSTVRYWILIFVFVATGQMVLAEDVPILKHCKTFRDGLNKLDLSNDPYFNQVHNLDVGKWECLVETENLSLDELKIELAQATNAQKIGCDGKSESTMTASCQTAHAYLLLLEFDLEARSERPVCHEYFRSRDNDHPTDEQNARHLQLCDKEENEQSLARSGAPAKSFRDLNLNMTDVFIPNCGSLNADQCDKRVVKALGALGCQSVQMSCNENKTSCIFGSTNCAPPFKSYVGHACYMNDKILHVGSIDGKTPSPFPGEFICQW